MKMIIVVALALVALAVAAPPTTLTEPIKIIRYEYERQPEGAYVFGYETENGIVRSENGQLKDGLDEENKPRKIINVQGSYSFPGLNGEPEVINYYADETGFHAEGKSIPKPVSRR